MHQNERNPAARSGAAGSLDNSYLIVGNTVDTLPSPNFQAAIIARKYHLTPLRARLACEFAGIGGRAR